ncbi:HAD-IIA family hydrolase [Arthrobacter sp. H14-L1]|uniref:HAD-IIA family hydrolase n=1 Tax=Arthrobacter sp. H14-L1 TaxID=2996697 RepID=UPI00226E8C32|nr:HAD-IIA family hydrolase [Arthrobacter sp. H14-L1]MCY0906433.1 HAD-IIA family hydrolase [Arthrobacter sp. H14-L1]
MAEQALIAQFDAVLADLDGVVYLGPHAIPGATDALKRLADFGVGLAYVTNNASRSPAAVAAHLRELGAPAEDHQVVSSAQAGAALLAEKFPPGSKVLVTGSEALAREVELVGMRTVRSAREGAVVVIQGFEPTLSWKELAEASYAIAGGAAWVATNTDMTIPQAGGIAPGNGTLVAAVQAATGKDPLVAGKPEAVLFHKAADRVGSTHPLVVGDRLDTDILGGNNAAMATAVVLTGVDTFTTILAARTVERPRFLLATLAELFEPYPQIRREGEAFRCGQATASAADGTVTIWGAQEDADSWRCACAAWWNAEPHATAAKSPELRWHSGSKG